MSHSIRHSFHQDPLLPFYSSSTTLTDGCEDGESIITVYTDGVQAVSWPSGGDPVTSVLIDDRCGDGEAGTLSSDAKSVNCDLRLVETSTKRMRDSTRRTRCSCRTRYKARREPNSYQEPRESLPRSPHLHQTSASSCKVQKAMRLTISEIANDTVSLPLVVEL